MLAVFMYGFTNMCFLSSQSFYFICRIFLFNLFFFFFFPAVRLLSKVSFKDKLRATGVVATASDGLVVYLALVTLFFCFYFSL